MAKQLFDVDVAGMRKIALRRGVAFVALELLQNAFDQKVTRVDFQLDGLPDGQHYVLSVTDDDPDGFNDLKHAYTLYGDSYKRTDATKRGFQDAGEKWVIAVCEDAVITSTTGQVRFSQNGRSNGTKSRDVGTEFKGTLKLTKAEAESVLNAARAVIPPKGVTLSVNGETMPHRETVASFTASLPTVIADEEGVMRRTMRRASVKLYEPLPGETPTVFEIGIPVVETNDLYHYDVQQRCPVNADRDSVPPAFLKTLRVLTMNAVAEKLTPEQASETWAREATGDKRIESSALEKALNLRFGTKRVSADPKDKEANNRAMAEGYTVVWGGSLSKDEWAQVKEQGLMKAAGAVFPTKVADYGGVEGGTPENTIPESSYTPGMRRIADFAVAMGQQLLRCTIRVKIVNEPIRRAGLLAWYGEQELTFNLGRLGRDWFEWGLNQNVLSLVLHELAHEKAGNHLDHSYHDALCDLGAAMAQVALDNPHIFDGAPGTPGARAAKGAVTA